MATNVTAAILGAAIVAGGAHAAPVLSGAGENGITIQTAGQCYDSEDRATQDARDDVAQATIDAGQRREYATVVYERDDTSDGEPDCFSYVTPYPGFDGTMGSNTLLPLNEADFRGDPLEYIHSHNFQDERDWKLSPSDISFAERQGIEVSVVVNNSEMRCLGFYNPEDDFKSETCIPSSAPEPPTLALLVSVLGGVWLFRARKRRRQEAVARDLTLRRQSKRI